MPTLSTGVAMKQQEIFSSFHGLSLLPSQQPLPLLARYTDQIPVQVITFCLPENVPAVYRVILLLPSHKQLCNSIKQLPCFWHETAGMPAMDAFQLWEK